MHIVRPIFVIVTLTIQLSCVCSGDDPYAIPDGGEQELMRFIMKMDAPSKSKQPEAGAEQTKRKQEEIAKAAQRGATTGWRVGTGASFRYSFVTTAPDREL